MVACPHCGGTHPLDIRRCPATGRPMAGDPSLVGRLFAGRYHLVRLLGDGGMGAVYKAADQVLRRFVAIKLLHPTVARNPAAVERFEREARAAAAIGHPNIIDIIDFGQERGRPYMVMEYLRGRSLSQAITLDGPLPVERAATIAVHTLAGLQAAHERGILHRDLKPANLMLVARFGDPTFVKVCDFGFAALLSARTKDSKTLTPERTLVGTPAYAAPERLRGDDRRDRRIDIYSVGVLLYEMLAGRRPFDAPTFRELARMVRTRRPAPLAPLRLDVPRPFEDAILAALSKDPADRWPDADAFAQALLPFSTLEQSFSPDQPSDSFTMEMARIRARDARLRGLGFTPDQPRRRDQLGLPTEPPRLPLGSPSTEHDPPPTRIEGRRSSGPPMEEEDPTVVEHPSHPVGPPVRPSAAPPPPPGTALGGRLVLAILDFVRDRYGERALAQLLSGMPPSARAAFVEGIDAERWVSFAAVGTLLEHIDAQLGDDDLHLILESGRAAAEGAFDLLPASGGSPEVLVAELPTLLRRLFRGIACEVRRVGRGYGRLELTERSEPSLTLTVGTLGFLERSLQQFGASQVEVNLLSARALNDPQTLVDLSWFVAR